ncbi:probable ribosome production factor 1 [Drosophila innubila]|uniref:probable ribosome production factor 1 n=1 Tax=Drosophila innubila TaxID=198719 RepID=UPI00148DF501|nr:probable ribosome production factor 1 [Drosophila innubila]
MGKIKRKSQPPPVEEDSDSDSSFAEEEIAEKDEGTQEAITDSSDEDSDVEMDSKQSKKKEQEEDADAAGDDDDDDNGDDDDDEDDDDDDDDDDEDKTNGDVKKARLPVLNPLSLMRNKEQRMALFRKMKKEKHKKKMQERRARRKAGLPANPGHTIESLREKDQTEVSNLNDSDNEELRKELEIDDFSSYFERIYEPKVLITFADNPVTKTRKFGLELSRIFPNALVKIRNKASVKKICKSAEREQFTDVVIINEDRRKPNGLLVIHLPNGPTAHFKLSNVKLTTDIKRNHKEITKHRPEVILTNFTTRLGLTVGRMMGALFHHDPEFRGRRAVTFHNQRDYIFFRHHRYEFSKEGKRVKLRELGPRFTLKLRSLQEGTFDSKTGDYTWIISNKRHAMESRRRFFL